MCSVQTCLTVIVPLRVAVCKRSSIRVAVGLHVAAVGVLGVWQWVVCTGALRAWVWVVLRVAVVGVAGVRVLRARLRETLRVVVGVGERWVDARTLGESQTAVVGVGELRRLWIVLQLTCTSPAQACLADSHPFRHWWPGLSPRKASNNHACVVRNQFQSICTQSGGRRLRIRDAHNTNSIRISAAV